MTIADDIREERRRLHATLTAVGPNAKTSLAKWTARDLASHLAAQDRLRGLPALLARSTVQRTGLRLTSVYLDRPRVSGLMNGPTRPWNKSLTILSKAPPKFVTRPRVAPITLWEHLIHHEDVRRANGVARDGIPDLAPVLTWLLAYNESRLPPIVRRETRGQQTRLEFDGAIAVKGNSLDVVHWLSGRDSADLHVDGPAELNLLQARLRI